MRTVVKPSLWALPAFILLACVIEKAHRFTLGGLFVNFAALSMLYAIHRYCPRAVAATCEYCGRNTLSIVVFSPIFMIPTKFYARFFDFDPTGLLFGLGSTAVIIAVCVWASWLLDKWRVSAWLFGKEVYSPYREG